MSLQTLKECPHSLLSSPHFLFCPQFTQSGLQSYPVEAILCKIMNEELQVWSLSLCVPSSALGMVLHALFLEILLPRTFRKTPLSFFFLSSFLIIKNTHWSWQGAEDFLFIPALGMESQMWVNNKMGFFLWGVYPGVLMLAAGAL